MSVYDAHPDDFLRRYERLDTPEVHGDWLSLLPTTQLLVLDVGAGSGRDAAWFAEHDHEVVAVEPADALRKRAQEIHPSPRIQWLDDRLPALNAVCDLDYQFDVILLSAVWMHVPPSDRERAFRKLTELLKPGGHLVVTLRSEPPDDERMAYETSTAELRDLSHSFALEFLDDSQSEDQLGRGNLHWTSVVFRLPDDGTGALPLIRHILINDDTFATYKPALLRSILRVANSAHGAVLHQTENYVTIPLGLVALYWLRMYRWLMTRNDYHQMPQGSSPKFDKPPFHALQDLSDTDLRLGRRFTGSTADALIETLRLISGTIREGPARKITYPGGSDPVFTHEGGHLRSLSSRSSNTITLDLNLLETVGTLRIPRHVWDAFSQHATWIEPSILTRWVELLQKHNETDRPGAYRDTLAWPNVEHRTREVRQLASRLRSDGNTIRCVWSGEVLDESYAIDHCFPFKYWPNNHLWNLLPTAPEVNSRKSDNLPSAQQLADATDRIRRWWHRAYMQTEYETQFYEEASAALPLDSEPSSTLDDLLTGIRRQRVRLRTDQQIAEWSVE
jgi:SAM-dependent methyltransferase